MLRVESTTDGKYIGLTMPLDPRSPPAEIPVGGGVVFKPTSWTEVSPGVWRVRNAHYCAVVREVA
jgi:hypothetical protein